MTQAPVSPSGAGPRRPATLADLDAVPSTHTGHLIGGRLYAHPRPRLEHSDAETGLAEVLRGPFQRGRGGPGGWWILMEPEVRIGAEATVPDLAGWRRERLPEGPRGAHATVAPDWACEVLSPRTETFDRGTKAELFAAIGVEWLWFVDPEARTLEAYQRDGVTWRPAGTWRGEADVTAKPFDALTWSLSELWG